MPRSIIPSVAGLAALSALALAWEAYQKVGVALMLSSYALCG
jgi:hypothetical protein